MILVIDTSAWIDYFEGNSAGEKVKEYIENSTNEIYTNILSISEISSLATRKQLDSNKLLSVLFSYSKIYSINIDFSKEVGEIHGQIKEKIKDFGLVDAFILLTAKKLNAKIITGDSHFKGMKEAIIVN